MTKDFITCQNELHVFYLPSRSPALNPVEQVWYHLKNQELKSHQVTNLTDLEKLIRNKLRKMSKYSALLRGIFFAFRYYKIYELIYIYLGATEEQNN